MAGVSSYLPSIPSIPPTIPSTKPTTKPPPSMRDMIAAGITTTAPIVPYPRIIRTDPMHTITPRMMPMANSIQGGKAPKYVIHGNIPDQKV